MLDDYWEIPKYFDHLISFPDSSALKNISTFEELQQQATDLSIHIPIPRNLNIIFAGDSLSRYQYLDLVYFLKHGSWVDPSEKPNYLKERDYANWTRYYNMTNYKLKPYEECDCFRAPGRLFLYKRSKILENRYFLDNERNNSVIYLQKFGDDFFKSSWNLTDIHKPHGNLINNLTDFKPILFFNWKEMIEQYVCNIKPKPALFIFNAGLWKNNDLTNTTTQKDIVQGLHRCGIASMYKTTTKQKQEKDRNFLEYESELCNQTDYCLDLTWTGLIKPKFYWDRAHFNPPIYSYLNLELLSLILTMNNTIMNLKFEEI